MLASNDGGQPVPSAEPSTLPTIPGARTRKLLVFEFLVLAEYFLAPLFLGVTNYAGVWSDIGIVLFLGFVTTVVLGILVPLRHHLRPALRTRRERLAFHAVWVAAFVVGLFVTSTFQWGGTEATSRPIVFGSTTVYGPFGAWPSLTFFVPGLRLFGTLDVEILTVLGLLSILGASAIRLNAHRRARVCKPGTEPRSTFGGRAAALLVWTPLGLVTGCTACAPLYLAAVGVLAPGVSAGGLSSIPLVPWIGFAGFLYLFSFGVGVVLIRRGTEPDRFPPAATVGVPIHG